MNPASPEYLAGGAPAVRRARGAAHHRRGADRARPHRPVVRVRARRHPARHRHDGEGARQRRADRRVLGARRRRRRRSRPATTRRRSAASRSPRAPRSRCSTSWSARTCPARADAAGARLAAALQKVARRRRRARPRPAARGRARARPRRQGRRAAVPRRGLVVNAVTPSALRLAPSLLVTDAEIDEAVAILADGARGAERVA